jgi:uncharacterized protein YbjT (DUF2867 family)
VRVSIGSIEAETKKENDMSGSNPTVLTVGSSGPLAGLVVPELARRGARVRGLVRNKDHAEAVRENGAAEIAIGDLRDVQSLEAAVEGVDGVFHIGPAFVPDESQLGLNMANVAKRAGVRKFVFSAVIHTANGLANHASKQPVEAALFASGMDYTILYPTTLFQNIGSGWGEVLERGVFAEPFSKTVGISRVDYRDVAEVAAMALTGDRLAYGTFELSADGMPNREDIVAVMSEVLGRPIEAGEPTFEEWAAEADMPYDEHQMRMLAKVYAYYDRYGTAGNSLVLRAILGREPRTLRQYIEDLVAGVQTTAF